MREGSVLSMGVFIGASTRIVDRDTGEIFQGEVPAYSVVVPGSLPGKPGKSGGPSPSLYCAVIVKRVDEQHPRQDLDQRAAAGLTMPAADVTALARDLLRCPSVTPAEGGALALIESVLQGAGFTVERVTFTEQGTAPVDNLYARIGDGAPASRVRRPHRRGAAGRRGELDASAVRAARSSTARSTAAAPST